MDVTVKRSRLLPKSPRIAMMREMRQQDRQRWREGRRARLSHLPEGVVWHVALVMAGRESKAERALIESGFHAYTPLERVTVGSGVARRDLDRPLFPKYVFFARRLSGASIGAIREVRGVLGGAGGAWLSAPEGLVRGLIDSEGLGAFDHTDGRKAALREARQARLSTGVQVTILSGPLAGFPAEIRALKAGKRVACLVRLFGGDVPVETGIDNVEIAA